MLGRVRKPWYVILALVPPPACTVKPEPFQLASPLVNLVHYHSATSSYLVLRKVQPYGPDQAMEGRGGRSLQTVQGLFLGKLPLEEVIEGLLSRDQNSPLLYPHLQLPRRKMLTSMSTLHLSGKTVTTEVCYKTYFLHIIGFLHRWGYLQPRLPGSCAATETSRSCCRCRRNYVHWDHWAPFHKDSSSVYLKLRYSHEVIHSPRCHANHSWTPCPKHFLHISGFSPSLCQSFSLA